MTSKVWGDILRVIPISGGIYPLAAMGGSGGGGDVLLPNRSGEGDANNDSGGNNKDAVYVDPVRMMYCPDETTAGIEGGADLLIYATVNRHCDGGTIKTFTNDVSSNNDKETTNNGNGGDGKQNTSTEKMGTLASALSCQRDQYNRPITGSIHFCLSGMGLGSAIDVAAAISVKTSKESSGNGGTDEKWDGWNGRASEEATTSWSRQGDGGGGGGSGEESDDPNRNIVQYSVGVAVHGENSCFCSPDARHFDIFFVVSLSLYDKYITFPHTHTLSLSLPRILLFRDSARPGGNLRLPRLLPSSHHGISPHTPSLHRQHRHVRQRR